jgi:hypothetical protein
LRPFAFHYTRAELEIARQSGRRDGRKRQMADSDSKIESAKPLLANGVRSLDTCRIQV